MKRTRAPRVTLQCVIPRALPVCASLVLVACSFDPSGIAIIDDGAALDAGPVRDGILPPGDAGACTTDIHLELSVGGVVDPMTPGMPLVHALPGDVVELSARGSCGRLGALTYEWQISPIDETRATAAPDLSTETITVYPVLPKDYTVTLTVRSGDASATRSVLGIRVHAWQRHDNLPMNPDVRDLAIGGDTLWLVHSRGAHRSPLGFPPGQDEFVDLAAEAQGVALASDLGTVYYDTAGPDLWLGQEARRDDLFLLDLSDQVPTASVVDYSAVFAATAQVFDIIEYADRIVLASDRGVTSSSDGGPFSGVFTPPDTSEVHALASVAGELWGGSRMLYQVSMGGAIIDPYDGTAGADARIQALAVDVGHQELWVASDGNGVARLGTDSDIPTLIGIYNSSNDTLASDRIRDIAVEDTGPFAGDLWAATSVGVARYIRDRDTWLVMDADHGLAQRTNTASVAIDSGSDRRVIYVGTRSGLVSLRPE